MKKTLTVLSGDARQKWLAELLREDGFSVNTYDVPQLPDSTRTLPEALENAGAVILPMPAFADADTVRGAGKLSLRTVLTGMPKNALLLGGVLAPGLGAIRRAQVRAEDYAQSEAVAAANALPTAEGAIQLAMERLPVTLSGSRVLVMGFGRIGKVLAEKLRLLGAEVTVSARKQGDLGLIRAMGFAAEHTGHFRDSLGEYDCIFNTVPAPVLSPEALAEIRADCPILELASAPGCLSGSQPRPENYIPAPALPGRCAPKTAAAILKNEIVSILNGL